MRLRCTNPECPSRASDELPYFTVNMTVDQDGDPCGETPQDIDGEDFTCRYCGDNAEWVDDPL